LRAITRQAFTSLGLSGTGMEFASEMVIKASLKKLHITQVPATLSVDLRDRAPHLRPWRDGWRHLRYLLMLSPTWVFGVPAMAAMAAAAIIFAVALLHWLGFIPTETPFGISWAIIGGFLFTTGHLATIMALATHLYGVRSGYRILRPSLKKHGRLLTLESMLILGSGAAVVALVAMVAIWHHWASIGYHALPNGLPLVLAVTLATVGIQTIFGGFLLAIISGHEARIAAFEVQTYQG
jgi:hypothetical protein